MALPQAIQERIEELEKIVAEYPHKIPLSVAADYLDMNTDGLMTALIRGNTPFGMAYQKQDGGNRVSVIPTLTFYLWAMNINGACVRSHEKEGRA